MRPQDIFTRKRYNDIIIDSLDFCRREKGLEIWAYVIMSNHIHLLVSTKKKNLSSVIRDFKRYTARNILKSILNEVESRREWMLNRFELAAKKHKRNRQYQFWTHENHAIEILSKKFLLQKMAYIHKNPIRSGLVDKAEYWLYNSQRNYIGLSNILEIDIVDL